VQGSYTYSAREGNYPGSVSYSNGQIDPNISSQYDLIELLSNRKGLLPQDRPHSLKVDAYYTFVTGENLITIGGRVRAVSGIPRTRSAATISTARTSRSSCRARMDARRSSTASIAHRVRRKIKSTTRAVRRHLQRLRSQARSRRRDVRAPVPRPAPARTTSSTRSRAASIGI